MYRKLIKNKKAQNTAEYAILIALVIAGIVAMQTYAQRALQGRVRDASYYMTNTINTAAAAAGTTSWGASRQYEPYYLHRNHDKIFNEEDTQTLTDTVTNQTINSYSNRDGVTNSSYDFTGVELGL